MNDEKGAINMDACLILLVEGAPWFDATDYDSSHIEVATGLPRLAFTRPSAWALTIGRGVELKVFKTPYIWCSCAVSLSREWQYSVDADFGAQAASICKRALEDFVGTIDDYAANSANNSYRKMCAALNSVYGVSPEVKTNLDLGLQPYPVSQGRLGISVLVPLNLMLRTAEGVAQVHFDVLTELTSLPGILTGVDYLRAPQRAFVWAVRDNDEEVDDDWINTTAYTVSSIFSKWEDILCKD